MAKNKDFDFKNLNNSLNSGKSGSDSLNSANNKNADNKTNNVNINQHLNAMFNRPAAKQNEADTNKQSSGRLEFGSTGYAGAKTPIKPTTGGEIKLPVFKTPKQLKQEQKAKKLADKQKQQELKKQLKELQEKNNAEALAKQQSAKELFATAKENSLQQDNAKDVGKSTAKVQPSLAEMIANQKKAAAGEVSDARKAGGATPSKREGKIAPEKDFFATLEDMFKVQDEKAANKELTEEEKQKEILEQLHRIQSQQLVDKKEKKRKKRGFFWIILLSILLLLIIGTGIYIYYYVIIPREYEYVRISVSIVNADQVFYKTDPNGDRVPIAIDPGDSFNLIVVASNSSDIRGDKDAPTWSDLFVRFRIWVEIDGVNYYNFIELDQDPAKWHRYNKDEEDAYLNEQGRPIVVADDGYYYYKSILPPNVQINIIERITFSIHNITEEVAGKNATIHVQIEVLEDYSQIINRTYWSTAPHAWLIYLQQYVMGY